MVTHASLSNPLYLPVPEITSIKLSSLPSQAWVEPVLWCHWCPIWGEQAFALNSPGKVHSTTHPFRHPLRVFGMYSAEEVKEFYTTERHKTHTFPLLHSSLPILANPVVVKFLLFETLSYVSQASLTH